MLWSCFWRLNPKHAQPRLFWPGTSPLRTEKGRSFWPKQLCDFMKQASLAPSYGCHILHPSHGEGRRLVTQWWCFCHSDESSEILQMLLILVNLSSASWTVHIISFKERHLSRRRNMNSNEHQPLFSPVQFYWMATKWLAQPRRVSVGVEQLGSLCSLNVHNGKGLPLDF